MRRWGLGGVGLTGRDRADADGLPGTDRVSAAAALGVGRDRFDQVLRLADPVKSSESAQRDNPQGALVITLGKAGDYRLCNDA